MRVYLCSLGGKHTRFSEDRVLVGKEVFLDTAATADLEKGNVVLADGVGGNRAGAVAAFKVCTMISELETPTKDDFARINDVIIEQGRADENRRNMATTLTGINFSGEGAAFVYHVGNTRLYVIQAGMYLKQITEDDTVVNYLVKTGKLSEEEALTYPKRNEITACFGGSSPALLSIKMFDLDLEKQTRFLLTCDGVHEILTIDEMEDIIAECNGDWEDATKRLVNEAFEKGSTDDCSAVIIDCIVEVNQNGTEVSEECHDSARSEG